MHRPQKCERSRRPEDRSAGSRKERAPYNPQWRFHLASDSIDFFEYAIEVCDASIQYVEEHLDEVGGSTLPGLHWCPWGSQLVDEIDSHCA